MSTAHLLAVALGPVQDFIAAARRTGDLTAGSELLVEVAKATAQAIERQGGKLIFPATGNTDGPNKILAELPAGVEPGTVAKNAKTAAHARLGELWEEAKRTPGLPTLRQPLADEQIEVFLEVYAAWMPIEKGVEGYPKAREAVEGRLAARKNLREFAPAPEGYGGEKSPLDPAFECVIAAIPEPEGKGPLFLKKTETLDALSVLKRLRGKEGQPYGVPSTRDLAERRNHEGAFTVRRGEREADETPPSYPYFAILHADGDKMGELLEKLKTPEAHRALSQTLVGFCHRVKEIVEKEYDGYLVYAGGDDVLAFLPAHRAIACAMDIRRAFTRVVDTTLSAGVALVHYKEPLAHGLSRARRAEKVAKDAGRDRLCLAIHTRGGTPLELVQLWETAPPPPSWTDFGTWLEAYQAGTLSRGVAYELRKLAGEFEGLTVPETLLAAEAQRIWEKKEAHGKPPTLPEGRVQTPESLHRFAQLLIAARFLTQEGE